MIRLMNVYQLVGHAYSSSIDLRPYCVEVMPFDCGDGRGPVHTNIMMWMLYPSKWDPMAEPEPRLVGRMIFAGAPRVIDPMEGDGRTWVIEPAEPNGLSTEWRLEAVPSLEESIWLDRSRDPLVLADKSLADLHRTRTHCMYSLVAVERLLRETNKETNAEVYKGYETYLAAWRQTVANIERAIASKERVSK